MKWKNISLAERSEIAILRSKGYSIRSIAKKIGIIFDIFIESNYRRSGIADNLLEPAFQWFQKKKVKHIELSVDARNESAIKFWSKAGFFRYKLRMRKDLLK